MIDAIAPQMDGVTTDWQQGNSCDTSTAEEWFVPAGNIVQPLVPTGIVDYSSIFRCGTPPLQMVGAHTGFAGRIPNANPLFLPGWMAYYHCLPAP
ncbi:MAG: hypothetical protein KDB14_01895 [Planctomycetales bacterium]|nr:hypothetical protein [Planctomycetales bacterium]